MRKILALSVLISTFVFSVVHAEMTPVNAKFLKDYKKGISSFSLRTDNEQRNYEDSQIKVHVNNALFAWYEQGALGNTRKAFVQSHSDSIYHAVQAALGGYVQYFTAIGLTLDITNKTNEVLYIDLNKSIISIGGYQGRPITDSTKLNDSQSANIPPLILLPQKTITKELFRGDARYYDGGTYASGWIFPSDLSLGKNIFGDGSFLLALGDEKAKFIPMSFYREIDRNSIAHYITQK